MDYQRETGTAVIKPLCKSRVGHACFPFDMGSLRSLFLKFIFLSTLLPSS